MYIYYILLLKCLKPVKKSVFFKKLKWLNGILKRPFSKLSTLKLISEEGEKGYCQFLGRI